MLVGYLATTPCSNHSKSSIFAPSATTSCNVAWSGPWPQRCAMLHGQALGHNTVQCCMVGPFWPQHHAQYHNLALGHEIVLGISGSIMLGPSSATQCNSKQLSPTFGKAAMYKHTCTHGHNIHIQYISLSIYSLLHNHITYISVFIYTHVRIAILAQGSKL